MRQRGITLLPYSPLASGLLSGKYRRGAPLPKGARLAGSSHHASDFLNDRNWAMTEALRDFATRSNRSILDIAFGWLLARPVTASVIAGATSPEQIEQNVRAGATQLSAEDVAALDRMTQ
jgi:aryl-alcohol dehydrogenase-like predicted oxidoreductase